MRARALGGTGRVAIVIVAIETATEMVGVALATEAGEPIAQLEVRGGRRHAETLCPAIEFLCRQAGVRLSALTSVAVDVGPGLFTGLRVGVTTAKALAFAHDVPVIAVGSLEALAAAHARPGERVAAVIDARRGELYMAQYVDGVAVEASWVGRPEDVAARCRGAAFVVGDGTERYAEAFAGVHTIAASPSAVAVAATAARRPTGRTGNAAAVEVVYLRAPDAEINWVKR